MADRDEIAGLDAGLDGFELGNSTLGDGNNLMDGLIGSGFGNPSASATAASSTGGVNAAPAGGTPLGSPTAVTASSHHQQQPAFFNPVAASQWVFQDTPPYDCPVGAAPRQQWEFPLNLNQPLQQQQLSSHLQSSAAPAVDRNIAPVTAAANAPSVTSASAHTRNVQNTLTPAQRELLKTIAMPQHLQYSSPRSAGGSPESASSGQDIKAGASSPETAEPSKTNSRKRKSSAEVDDDDDDDELEQPVKKTAHNMIEKRYRTNLNDKIAALRDSVPSLRIMCKSARGEDTTEDREELHGLTPAHKLNKATVLSKATEYIRHLEKRNNRLVEENNNMQARIAAFEKLFMAGAMTGQLPNPLQQQPPTPIQYPQDATPFLGTPLGTPAGPDPPGMIPIPDDMKRILAAQQMNAGRPYPVPAQHFTQNPALLRQQQIQQQQQQAQAQAGRWNPYLGKLMVGSLAGLMLIEALAETERSSETTDGRGLSVLPVRYLTAFVRSTHLTIGGYHLSAMDLIASLRLLSLMGFLLWLACSSFIDTSVFRPSNKSQRTTSVVEAVPSLASPIHVRRQAWLTAIQTVWVPRHNFFLEAAALLLKTVKYTLRNVVGSHGYLTLTGLSEEQEAARIKAWSIALDAQLAGGDVEINKSRLTLTLIASGTLPDTPLRLMLKALHVRVLLWRFNDACLVANLIAAKLARSRWDEARQLNRILNSLPEGEKSPDDALPEHLAALLEQECDEVLNDDIIQRAHNLAWNEPTTYSVVSKIDGMDTVVDDAAVRSPMDAVAAWYSNLTLHRVLVNSLRKPRDNSGSAAATDDIALAVKVAPIGSNAQVRALVARAVLADGRRGPHIIAALQALGPDRHTQYQHSNSSSKGAVPPLTAAVPDPDARMALRCAMGIAQLQKFERPPPEAYMVIDSILPVGADIESMSLLAYTAAFHLMEHLWRHRVAREMCSRTLERLAGSLRIWIGSETAGGEKVGVEEAMRKNMIEQCLQVARNVVGMVADPGYASMEDCDGDGEGC
ncbi:sterol regulatory element-binding protein 1 [Achaetomium macrosporum]|uniref:Sterol regulatory element-binding protein 1 n=1 Tax=Achaetomium macrosporum TaxID=79813 RepID=A0AAN7CL19_9PEZI|nr:sterol regulatory element-binding protein 1 [Achaetomium macrosporum]